LGRSWKLITGDLPDRGTVYVVIEDPMQPGLLFAGTEFGLYVSRDDGQKWVRLRGGLPTIQMRDLAIQKRDDALAVATFGRGFYVLDDLESIRALTPQVFESEASLLRVQRTPLFVQSSPDPNWQGERFYTAANPQSGAVFSYYLKEAIRTRQQVRQAADRAAARRGENVFYASWDSLRAEDREEAPAMILTVSDPEGRVVQRLTGAASAGVQRVVWNLRYPSTSPVTSAGATGARGGGGGVVGLAEVVVDRSSFRAPTPCRLRSVSTA
jgi:hypothetical protein